MAVDEATPIDRYSTVAIILHWTIALAILSLLAIGLYMTNMPTGMTQFRLFQLHKSIGITVLALSALRLIWRLTHRAPPLPPGTRWPERAAAHGVHAAFYVLMLGMPLTGWAMATVSPMNLPTLLYGILPLPPLPGLAGVEDRKGMEQVFDVMHVAGAWVLIALIPLHVGAALFHQFRRRDNVLHHMIPFVHPTVTKEELS
jgi:cytochrome b561